MRKTMGDVEERLGLFERQYSPLSRRLGRAAGDIELAERRLDLVDAP